MAQVSISLRPIIVDIFSDHQADHGTLTNDDASSRYGMPVIVINGHVLGSKEIGPYCEIFIHYTYRPQTDEHLYETDEQIRARRTPAEVALAHAAVAAGYPIANV